MKTHEHTTPLQPRSTPIQSSLTNSNKQKRIPAQTTLTSSSGSSTTASPSKGKIPKHKLLPEITTRLSNLPTFKLTPVGETYRHLKSASYDEKANDKKRLVDQFYDQLGTPPPSAPGTRVQTPSLTRNNTSTAFTQLDQSRTNLVLNRFEFEKKSTVQNGGEICEIGEMIDKLEELIVKKIKEQVEVNEEEFLNKVVDFETVLDEIQQVKRRIEFIITEVELEKTAKFNEDFTVFEKDVKTFMRFLKTLQDYEIKINASRKKMTDYKKKLYDIRTVIEKSEKLKVEQYEKSENRNKWIGVILMFSVLVLAYLKMF